MDSNAAARRQTQRNDIASGSPRLMEKAVARKTPPLNKKGLWLNLTAALSDSQSTSQSAPADSSPIREAIAAGHLRPADGVYFISLSRQNFASESERTAMLFDRKSTSQSALLTAPLSGEPLRPAICGLRTAFFFYPNTVKAMA